MADGDAFQPAVLGDQLIVGARVPKRRSGGGKSDLRALEAVLEHRFSDGALLQAALDHSSLSGRTAIAAALNRFDRLEFLGDRVVGLVLAEMLLERYPEDDEGAIARRHATLVNRDSLASVARTIGLGRFLRLSSGEAQAGGGDNPAVLADAFEAVVAALYRDGGMERARAFLVEQFTPLVAELAVPPQDAKTALQEWAQGRGIGLPVYRTLEVTGPAHRPLIAVEVRVEGLEAETAKGSSRRAAEQAAAAALLARARAAK
ncbi:MAG: ribonuclease III [Alphaproteobacteria bacterium]|nr:ribonuclease III [Alphaproteobacteria bacterium]